jgi:hypothetical protein
LLFIALVVAFVYSLFLFLIGMPFGVGGHLLQAMFVTFIAVVIYALLTKLTTQKE